MNSSHRIFRITRKNNVHNYWLCMPVFYFSCQNQNAHFVDAYKQFSSFPGVGTCLFKNEYKWENREREREREKWHCWFITLKNYAMMQIIVILWGMHALFIPSFSSIREKNGWYQDDSSSVIDVSSSFFQISGRKIFRRTNYIHTISNLTLFMKINTVHCTCVCYSTVNSLAIFYSISCQYQFCRSSNA